MTAEAPPIPTPAEGDDLKHYSPEEVVDPDGDFRLPTTADELRKKVHARQVPFRKIGGRIVFRRVDIREISDMYAVRPVTERRMQPRKPRTSAA